MGIPSDHSQTKELAVTDELVFASYPIFQAVASRTETLDREVAAKEVEAGLDRNDIRLLAFDDKGFGELWIE